jgi:hypothetical protein
MSVCTRAQIMQDANGRPVLEKKYIDVEGNPYLTDDWLQGTVTLASGESYKDVPLKYDLVRNEPLFRNSKGEAMSFVSPVRKFTLINLPGSEKSVIHFRNGYKPADGGTAETFYQVLADGETPLLKKIFKVVTETKPFNSATTIKTFEQVQVLFIVKDGLPVKLRKDKKVVLEALGDYSAQLEEYIKTNKLNLKSEPGLIALVAYYNSLK